MYKDDFCGIFQQWKECMYSDVWGFGIVCYMPCSWETLKKKNDRILYRRWHQKLHVWLLVVQTCLTTPGEIWPEYMSGDVKLLNWINSVASNHLTCIQLKFFLVKVTPSLHPGESSRNCTLKKWSPSEEEIFWFGVPKKSVIEIYMP